MISWMKVDVKAFLTYVNKMCEYEVSCTNFRSGKASMERFPKRDNWPYKRRPSDEKIN